MPTTPSPYNYNRTRYRNKTPRTSQGPCLVIAFILVIIPITTLTAIGGLIVQNV